MIGTIRAVTPQFNVSGGRQSTTVIYERGGQGFRGCQFHDGTYYFGGAAHLPNLQDIDAAWEQEYLHARYAGRYDSL